MAKLGTTEVYEEMAHTERTHLDTALSTDVDSRLYSLVGFGWDE